MFNEPQLNIKGLEKIVLPQPRPDFPEKPGFKAKTGVGP
jgi:hypothetical protein